MNDSHDGFRDYGLMVVIVVDVRVLSNCVIRLDSSLGE